MEAVRKSLVLAFSLFLIVVCFCTTGANSQEQRKVHTGVTSAGINTLPLWVGKFLGFFAEQKINNEIVVMRSAARQVQALIAGSIELSAQAPDPLIRAVENGADLLMLSGLVNAPTYDLLAAKKYKSIEDLRGTTLGVSGITSSIGLLLQKMLSAHGLVYRRDYSMVEVGGTGSRLAALQSGAISAGLIGPPFSYVAVEQGFNMLGDMKDYIPEVQFTALSVSKSWAYKNQNLIEDYLVALLKTNRYIYENKSGTKAIIQDLFKVKPEYAERVYDYWVRNKVLPRDGNITVKGTEVVMDILEALGDFKGKVRPKAEKYIDTAFLSRALTRLPR